MYQCFQRVSFAEACQNNLSALFQVIRLLLQKRSTFDVEEFHILFFCAQMRTFSRFLYGNCGYKRSATLMSVQVNVLSVF